MRIGYKRLAILAVAALAAIAAVMVARTIARPVAVRVELVASGTVREETKGPGTVQSRYAVSVASRVAASVERVLVDVGDEVKRGQLLATLDQSELAARLGAARGAVASAQQEVVLARANLAKARSDRELARIQDERARQLVERGVSPVAEADEARGARRAAEAAERAARAAVDSRVASLERLRDEQRAAETILSYATLESPMSGIITRRVLEPGSATTVGSVVVQIVDPDALWVATMVDQSLVGRVQVGQRAIIQLRSGAKLSGHVARISFEADPVTRELEVDVAFDARPARFAIHEEADVTILGAEAQGLVVPLAAIKHGRDGSRVFVIEDGRARQRRVQLGLVGSKHAQVVEGLAGSEMFILTPDAVRDGQRVTASGG